MQVSPRDGRCRVCGGTLTITDADDATMEVECADCGEFYAVETDAFGDGGMTYWPAVMTAKIERSDP